MTAYSPTMDLAQYCEHVRRIPCGKRVNSALYVYRSPDSDFGAEVNELLARIQKGCAIPLKFNVVKFRIDELKISLLWYPDFFQAAHPLLVQAFTVDLATGKSRLTDYSDNVNPPILHRKEAFLPLDHPMRDAFAALTKAEEEAGLYEDTTTIGFKLNWERLLSSKGLAIEGNSLQARAAGLDGYSQQHVEIERHKTALTRYDLSKPVKRLIEHGLLKSGATVFDYGCGRGSDITALRSLGYEAEGWDPVYRNNIPKQPADIVNLGYVLNVIEDPVERLEVLMDAFRLAKRLLVVSGLINRTVDPSAAVGFSDGVVTQRNTFQRYFDQGELHQFIEDALESTAIPVALGIFYVFRDPADQQDFLSLRTKRVVELGRISARLGLARPRARTKHGSLGLDLYEQHNDLLDAFWNSMLDLGRLPQQGEFDREQELRKAIGSLKKAECLFVTKFGNEPMASARDSRRGDLLVYLALANLKKPTPFSQLSARLRYDIRWFFGDYPTGLGRGRDLLFAAGDPGEIELACEDVSVGYQDQQALYVHSGLLDALPPLLRVYVACAAMRYGDMQEVDIIKIHKFSRKVTFLVYDDFDRKPAPELRQRIKVNLRTLFVQVFDYPNGSAAQLLYFKERYLRPDYPGIDKMRRFSEKLHKLGLNENMGFGPTKEQFLGLAESHGLNANLNRKRSVLQARRSRLAPDL